MSQSYNFKVVYEKSHDGKYRAWVPALPACQAKGDTMPITESLIEEAIHCYCQNMLENGAAIPQTPPGLPSIVNEIEISLDTN